ncbi:MAG: CHASE4 domain-containing protein [FCB group bacterium]|jgi:PAS domain S-box-containing protein|nr:CHASE4 domain-containing protein [FCB group bacterium]
MSLRRRTFLTIGTVLLLTLAAAFSVVWTILSSQFDRLEETIVFRNLERATRTIEAEVLDLDSMAQDWACWDDTYNFMGDQNQEFLDANLTLEALMNLHINFMVFLDNAHGVVAARVLDLEQETLAPDAEALYAWFRGLAVATEDPALSARGLSISPKGVALVATCPILRSTRIGPSRGTLVVGTFLTEPEVARIERRTMLKLSLTELVTANLPPELHRDLVALQTTATKKTRAIGSHWIGGYQGLNDIQGKPAILLRVMLEREAREFRQYTWAFMLASTVIIGLLVIGGSMAVLEKLMLARLLSLSRSLNHIAAQGDPSARVEVDSRNDELSWLSNETNVMLAALERSREDLRSSEAVARALLDAPDSPAVLLNPDARILGLNRKAAEFFRRRSEGFLRQSAPRLDVNAIYHERLADVRRAVETRSPLVREEAIDGRHYVHNLYPVTNEADEVVQVALFSRDITDQKRGEERERQRERRYRNFVHNSHGIVFQTLRDGSPVLCEGNVEAFTGISEAEFLSGAIHWRSIIHPDDLAAQDESWHELLTNPGMSSQNRYRIIREDGEVRWGEEFVQSVPGPDGETEYIQGVLFDITDRVADEQALRESLRTTADIVRAIPSGLLTFRYEAPARFVLLDCNPEAERLTGFSLEQCRGREFRELWPGNGAHVALRLLKRVVTTGRVYETEAFQHSSGKSKWAFRVRAFPLPGRKLAVAFEDILERRQVEAERKRLEEQLHHSQKMEAIGQLAGGVAHDFNNLLGGILGYASLLRLEASSNPVVNEAAQTIEQAAERAADLTRQLLGFARRGKFQNVVVNLHDTVKEVAHLLDRTLDKNIRIVQDFHVGNANVMGDPNQLQQVLVNLALNARDAMPDGGDLTFESCLMDKETVASEIGPDFPGQPFVVISVSDQGCGILPEHVDRIFEPFFTTKEQGKGTGMGLAMVYGIVKNHGGTVQVQSQVGHGTAFRIWLPAAPANPMTDAPSPNVEAPRTGSAHILLVDDEAIIRNMGSTVLSRLGYSVITVDGGHEAVEYYREHGAKVDLVILDMVMPEMGGHECFRALQSLNPKVRAILSSGYGINGKASEMLGEGMLGFIQKPYRVTELSIAVARALETEKR